MNKKYKNNIIRCPDLKEDKYNFIRIIQVGAEHTGSTLLTNLIYGIFLPDESIHWINEGIEDHLILKTHSLNIEKLIKLFYNFKLYFCVSERTDHECVDNKYINYSNVLYIHYDEINETQENTLTNIINNVYNKFIRFFPKELFVNLNESQIKENALSRIINMNKLYETIKDKPFSFCNYLYGIRGHHRNRIK